MSNMTNWQLLIAAGLPTATGLVSIALALTLNGRLESRMDHFESRLDRMAADLSQFYLMLGKHDGKIESLEKRLG